MNPEHIRAEQPSAEMMSALLNHLPEMVFVKDANTKRYVYVNQQVEKAFGIPCENWIGKTAADFFPEDVSRLIAETDHQATSTGQPQLMSEMKMVVSSGRDMWYSSRMIPFGEQNQQPLYLLGIGVDITQLKQAQLELAKSESEHRALIEQAPVFIALVQNERLTYINPFGMRLLGATHPRQLLGKSIARIVPPENLGNVKARLARIGSGRSVEPAQGKFIRLDKEEVPIIVTGVPFTNHGQSGVQVIAQDISRLERLDSLGLLSEQRLRQLYNVSPIGIFRTGTDGLLLDANKAFFQQLELSSEDLGALNFKDLFVSDERFGQWLAQLKSLGQARGFAAELFNASGERVRVLLDAWLVTNEQDAQRIEGTLKTIIAQEKPADVATAKDSHQASELEKSQNFFQERDKEHRFIANELHDELGQLLTAIGFSLSGMEQHVSHDRNDELSGQLEATKSMLESALAKLKDFSSLIRPPEIHALSLTGALDLITKKWERLARIPVSFSHPQQALRVPEKIKRALYRIAQESLNNAFKHASASHIWVDLAAEDDALYLRVKDDGTGFDVDQSPAMRAGLGLVGMQERVASVGGALRVTSAPDQGTCVEVTVPYAGAQPPSGVSSC